MMSIKTIDCGCRSCLAFVAALRGCQGRRKNNFVLLSFFCLLSEVLLPASGGGRSGTGYFSYFGVFFPAVGCVGGRQAEREEKMQHFLSSLCELLLFDEGFAETALGSAQVFPLPISQQLLLHPSAPCGAVTLSGQGAGSSYLSLFYFNHSALPACPGCKINIGQLVGFFLRNDNRISGCFG